MNLINGMAAAGVEVHVLVSEGDFPDLSSAAEDVIIHRLAGGRGRAAVARLSAFLDDLRPSVVLSNRDNQNALVVAAAARVAQRPKVALRIGIDVPAKLRHRSPISRWRQTRRLRTVYRGADLLIGNSAGVSRGLKELLGEDAPPIHTLHNPLDLERARRLAREPADHPWFGRRDFRLLVSVGRLVQAKDHATTLRALAQAPQDCRLVVFGEGSQRSRLLDLAAELGVSKRFDLPGHTDNPFAHLARADLFLLTSRFEGSPNALIEALAVGTPVVATDCPSGPREILDDGRFGRLVPVGDHRALATAITETLANPPLPTQLDEAVVCFERDDAVAAYLRALGLDQTEEPA